MGVADVCLTRNAILCARVITNLYLIDTLYDDSVVAWYYILHGQYTENYCSYLTCRYNIITDKPNGELICPGNHPECNPDTVNVYASARASVIEWIIE